MRGNKIQIKKMYISKIHRIENIKKNTLYIYIYRKVGMRISNSIVIALISGIKHQFDVF